MNTERLTSAERAIAQLVAQGCKNDEIARLRGTSPRTVANQLAALYQKLGVGSRMEMVRTLDAQLEDDNVIALTGDNLGRLSSSEKKTLETAARGVPMKVIAIDLGLAPHTIAARLQRCARKLGMGSRIAMLRVCGRIPLDLSA